MFIISLVLQSLLLLFMLYQSVSKIKGEKIQVELFNSIKLPQWFRVVTGFVQLAGAAGLIVGYWYPGVIAWAGIWIGITMLVACLTHFRVKHPIGKAVPPFVIVLIATALIFLHIEGFVHPLI
ncbi:DoxX family protein [Paenibacillus sp. HJGM_3]|uniref:DoxX family protein n=1 Tax=Paenibacillus sp. HJGM_3 TaxID=3379816 RepID=UPI00385B5BF5